MSEEQGGGKNRRKTKNILLEPQIQLRYGFYFSSAAVIFAALLGWILYLQMQDVLELVIQLTDVPQVTNELVETRLVGFFQKAAALFLGFAILCFAAGAYFTHRLVGPMVAFRRHVRSLREGSYNAKTSLRAGDDFLGFADELNALSDTLANK